MASLVLLYKKKLLPKHIAADEKHSRILGDKCYVATTTADGCILGASVAKSAGEQALTKAYGIFKEEANIIDPDYTPETVNTDGWSATQKTWVNLFPTIVLTDLVK